MAPDDPSSSDDPARADAPDADLFLGAEALIPAWTFSKGYGALSAPPVMAGDRVIGVAKSTVFAIDMYTGKLAPTGVPSDPEWVYTITGRFSGQPHVTAANGKVYLVHGDALIALGLADCRPAKDWKPPKVSSRTRQLFATGERVTAVYLDARGKTWVAGFDTATGAPTLQPKMVREESPGAIGFGDGAMFFVANTSLSAVNLDFGDPRWTYAGDGDALRGVSEPVVAGKVVLVTGNRLHGVDLVLGKKQFTVEATAKPGQPDPDVIWHRPVVNVPSPVVAATKAVNFKAARPLLGDAHGVRARLKAVATAQGGTGIATNSTGEVVCFSLIDGARVWRQAVESPGAPMLIDGIVYVATHSGTQLARFDAATGRRVGTSYSLEVEGLSSARLAAIGNGALLLADDDGVIVARDFAVQRAAYFDGASSMVKIAADKAQFDFGTDDFTVEAWFRSSMGGDILSSYTTTDDRNAHGFRLNLTPEGQIRVAVLSGSGESLTVGRTRGTGAADGEWHHVAFVRETGKFKVVLDGLARDVLLPEQQSDTSLSIGGNSALTIGGFIAAAGAAPISPFRGLIREVRIWDRALDVPTVANNRAVEYTGLEPRLKGLWRLDEMQEPGRTEAPRNAVSRHRARAIFVNPASKRTSLKMDRSAFPYVLHESTPQWPYAGAWAARGEHPMTGTPAVSSDGIVAFSTDNVLYAVGAHDGKRVWSMDVDDATSDPIADGPSFLILSADESLVRVDSRSGGKVQVEAFAEMPHDPGLAVLPPVVTEEWMAAAAGGPEGTIAVWDLSVPLARSVTVGGTPQRLAGGAAGLGVVSKSAAGLSLSLIDPKSVTVRGQRKVTAPVLCMADKWLFAVDGTSVVKLDAARLDAPLATASISGIVTGLVALADDDLLVATTNTGDVHGLSLADLSTTWRTRLPEGFAGGANLAVNPPVLDLGGRVVCTTATGMIAILDGYTGMLMGSYGTTHGSIAAAPAIAAGTVFTGCTESDDPEADIDGALHSVVFGNWTAMRLNLDRTGKPVAHGKQHAVIDQPTDAATLHLMEVHESCVEAWVNVPVLTGADAAKAGGGIVGIAPAKESGFDMNLWLEPDGTVHYASRTADAGVWSGLHVSAATSIVDGRWHHIAASRSAPIAPALPGAPDRVIIYIDGQPVPTMPAAPLAAPTHIAQGLKGYVGAIAADDLAASRPFHGMIAEVRVWDTYLVATEISSRMHVKLRGDEPDLIAYWNFDYGAVHDSAVQGHDGVLAEAVTEPVWWLIDLPFTQPAYPYISTTASITRETKEATTYAVTLKVCAGDGTGIGQQDVRLWYLKRKATDPATILVNTTEIAGVSSGDGRHPVRFDGTTNDDGTLRLNITTTAQGHGPAIDMWTAFMPVNERYHVNVLLDNQTLSKPTPPSLTAQAKLMQDYHYTTGSAVNHTRDRSTWRVVVRAAEPSGGPRPKEPITLWASETARLEARGTTHTVNVDNSVTLDAELNGELTIVLAADGLTAPTLYARAAFMHRNDRIVISPDQDAHTRLSGMKEKDLTTERETNWKKEQDRRPEDKQSLLSNDQKPHAGEIAEAVRHVTSATAPADPNAAPKFKGLTPARRKLLTLRQIPEARRAKLLAAGNNASWSPPLLAAMKQPEVVAPTDRVILRRALAGVERAAPVDPDALRHSLRGDVGFVFEGGRGKQGAFTYRRLHTQEEADRALGVPTPETAELRLGGIFDDVWDGIKDTANTIYDGATRIVVTIGDQIKIAITKMVDGLERIVHTVVNSVGDALRAVAGFFEQLAIAIMKVIAFLRALFDWRNIIKTHDILFDIISSSLKITTGTLKNPRPLTNALRSIAGVTPRVPAAGQSLAAASNAAGGKDSEVIAGARSVEGKSMADRATSTPVRRLPGSGDAPDPTAAVSEPMELLLQRLPAIASSFVDLSPGDLVRQILDLLKDAASVSLVTAGDALAGLMGHLVDPIGWAQKILEAHIDIPFISELYEWITGRPLSILSVACLAFAVQVNVVYAILTLVAGNPRFFFEDAQSIAATMKTMAQRAENSAPLLAASAEHTAPPPQTPLAPEVCYMVFRTFTAMGDQGSDFLFIKASQKPLDPIDSGLLAMTNIFQGIAGSISMSLQTFCCQVAFEKRVKAVVNDEASNFLPKYIELSYTIYGILMALRINKLRAGATYLIEGPQAPGITDRIKDKIELPIAIAVSGACAFLVPYQIGELYARMPELEKYGNSNLTEEYRLLAIRDILSTAAGMFEFLFTAKGAANFRSTFPVAYEPVMWASAVLRTWCSTGGIVLHGVAKFKYGDIDY